MSLTLEDWYVQIEQNPIDWELRSVFADWLEDQGETTLALGQRWQVKHQRTPQHGSAKPNGTVRHQDDWMGWYLITESFFKKNNLRYGVEWRYMWILDEVAKEFFETTRQMTREDLYAWSDSLRPLEAELAEAVARLSNAKPTERSLG